MIPAFGMIILPQNLSTGNGQVPGCSCILSVATSFELISPSSKIKYLRVLTVMWDRAVDMSHKPQDTDERHQHQLPKVMTLASVDNACLILPPVLIGWHPAGNPKKGADESADMISIAGVQQKIVNLLCVLAVL